MYNDVAMHCATGSPMQQLAARHAVSFCRQPQYLYPRLSPWRGLCPGSMDRLQLCSHSLVHLQLYNIQLPDLAWLSGNYQLFSSFDAFARSQGLLMLLATPCRVGCTNKIPISFLQGSSSTAAAASVDLAHDAFPMVVHKTC